MTDVHKITLQINAPRGVFPGEVAEGWYVVFENNVILTDQNGKPISGVNKRRIESGGDARLIACQMVRSNRRGRASTAGFNRPISYPTLKY